MSSQFLEAAARAGNTICRDAIRYNGRVNWIGADQDPASGTPKPYFTALKSSWYNGTSGIAWFLTRLYSVTGEQQHARTALAAIEQALQGADALQLGKLGFHSGLTGVAFAAIEIGEILGREEYVERGMALLHQLNRLPESEYTLDVIDGCAGAIPAIIRIHRKYPDAALTELLSKMGDYLLRQAQAERTGISWNTVPKEMAASNLTGYAHGAAGIATALLELYHHTADERFLKAGRAGIAYEESCFDREQSNWPDFRHSNRTGEEEKERFTCGCAWCHGAPGIGLSRLRAFQITGDAAFRHSGEVAMDTTLRFFDCRQLGNYSLCHGLFGNADLLLCAAEVTGDKTPAEKAQVMGIEAIEQFERKNKPLPNGTQSELSSPDMMLGLAGMGYGFLRLADSRQFESVLLIH